jgi:hypothetical protein
MDAGKMMTCSIADGQTDAISPKEQSKLAQASYQRARTLCSSAPVGPHFFFATSKMLAPRVGSDPTLIVDRGKCPKQSSYLDPKSRHLIANCIALIAATYLYTA